MPFGFLSHYGWRGAEISNILDFEKDWPDCKIIKLEENYRSRPVILECANSVIKNNKQRRSKALRTNKSDNGLRVKVQQLPNNLNEAEYVAGQIRELRETTGFDYDDMTILYRANAQSRSFEEIFRKQNIPYETVGAISFYARAEIKDMLAYLSLLINRDDDISFIRAINTPRRGIGPKSLEKLEDYANFKGWSLYHSLEHLEEIPTIKGALRNKLLAFRNLIEGLKHKSKELSIGETITEIYKTIGYKEWLKKEDKLTEQTKKENVQELINSAVQYTQNVQDATIESFLSFTSLSTTTDEYEPENKVKLMTLHSAKGLEFPVVFMVGMEQNQFPTYRAVDKGDIEEERRLCYVGITRAKERLYMTHVQERFVNGSPKMQRPSVFLKELPPEKIDNVECSRYYENKSEANNPLYQVNIIEPEELESDIVAGDTVQSKAFGVGKVMINDNGILTIAFPGIGVKVLASSFVEKI